MDDVSKKHIVQGDIIANQKLIIQLEELLQYLKNVNDINGSRERALAITKIQEGTMWLVEDRKRLESIGE